ncbi:MAG: hypothetical protein LBJ87_10875, partial [bacterium]|nr:hypothetical protein [bacterium]
MCGVALRDGGPIQGLAEHGKRDPASTSGAASGLGLAIADAIVEASGGRWEVGTSEQGGARMAVTWPRTLAGSRAERRREAAATAGRRKGPGGGRTPAPSETRVS